MVSWKRVGINGENSPEKSLWERKRSLRAVRLERSGMGPERRFCLRLRTRSWVRAVGDSNEPWRSRSSRTSHETRSWRHETPVQVHGLVVEFEVVSLFALSIHASNAKRGSKSGFFEAWEKRKWRMRRKKVKGRRNYWLGFVIVVCILTDVWVCACCFCVWLTRKISCWVCVCCFGVWFTRKISYWGCVYVCGFVIFGF